MKVTNDTLKRSAIDRSMASMSHIRHYRVVPWATEPLTLLESIAKVQTGKSLKPANHLSSDFFFSDNTITAEAILTIQMQKNSIYHWVLYPVLIVFLQLELFFSSVLARPFWSGGTTWFVWCTTWLVPANPFASLCLNSNYDIHSATRLISN